MEKRICIKTTLAGPHQDHLPPLPHSFSQGAFRHHQAARLLLRALPEKVSALGASACRKQYVAFLSTNLTGLLFWGISHTTISRYLPVGNIIYRLSTQPDCSCHFCPLQRPSSPHGKSCS